MSQRGGRIVAAVAVAAALAACSAPAPNLAAYRSKAARTAGAAVSELRTVWLAAGSRDRTTGAYLDVLVTDAEDAYGSLTSTFDSVQPPDDPAADRIRAALDELLSDGSDAISAARIAIRRNAPVDTAGLAQIAAKLEAFDPAEIQ